MNTAKITKTLRNIDRRFIYLLILASVVVPLIIEFDLPTTVTPEVKRIFDKVETLQGTGKAVLLSIDYEPSTQPELHPMSKAVVRHCFVRKIPIVTIANSIPGLGLSIEVMSTISEEYGAVDGVDWANMGFQTPLLAVMVGMGESIRNIYPTDYNKRKSSEIPLLDKIKNYNDIGLLVSLAGNTLPVSWVTYVGTPFNVPIATGVTAVSASDFYPYLQTNQFIGMMGGIKGAAEYEQLVDELENKLGTLDKRMNGFSEEKRAHITFDRYTARRAMNPQSVAHMVIIFFIILGNITYFAFERKQRNVGR